MFDYTLEIKRQGEGADSSIIVARRRKEPLQEDLAEKYQPFNFRRIFAPPPFDVQAKVLGIKNPWNDENPNAENHAQNYDDQASNADYKP
jgi:hypothetical protein